MKKMILIEGLPGSGKSTTAQWLHHSFKQSKISSQWFYELSEHHPLTYRSDRSKISGSQLLTESVDIWKRFIQSEMSQCEAIIIDSGFFQKNIMYMMNLNIDKKNIQKYAMKVEALISKCDTYFIYLDAGNAEMHMRGAFRARGKKFQNALTEWSNNTKYSVSKGYAGLEGCLKYWRDYKDLCDSIYKKSKFSKIEIGVTTGPWSEHYQALSRFLKVSNYENTNCSSILRAKLTGDYLMRDSDIVVSIKEKSDYLTITSLLHALEAESLMILDNSNRFFIRGHDVSLQFDKFRQGVAEVMKVSSSWSKLDGCVFERVTL